MPFEIRAATSDDADGMGVIHHESWLSCYRGIVPDITLEKRSAARSAERFREWMNKSGREDFVCVADGRVVGFINFGQCRDDDSPSVAEVFAIYILAEFWGKGAGRLLWNHAVGRMRGRGFKSTVLWVFTLNIRARGFYEHLGLAHDGKSKMLDIDGAKLEELRYSTAIDPL